MKEKVKKHVFVELEQVEQEAVETVLDFLERMTYIYEEEDVDEIFMEFGEEEIPVRIVAGMPERAIQALEEIMGVWR